MSMVMVCVSDERTLYLLLVLHSLNASHLNMNAHPLRRSSPCAGHPLAQAIPCAGYPLCWQSFCRSSLEQVIPCTGLFVSPSGASLVVFTRIGSIILMYIRARIVIVALDVFQLVGTIVVGYVVVCMAPTDKIGLCGIDICSLPCFRLVEMPFLLAVSVRPINVQRLSRSIVFDNRFKMWDVALILKEATALGAIAERLR